MEPEGNDHIGEIKPIGWRKRQIQALRVEEDDDIQDYKKPWVSLTDEEIESIAGNNLDVRIFKTIAQVIEAKLKEKNT